MKIIDKRKDYYDFLTGIYGEDPLIVFDRRNYDTINFMDIPNNTKVVLFFCGYSYDGIKKNGKIYWLTDINKFAINIKNISRKDDVAFVDVGLKRHLYFKTVREKRSNIDPSNPPIMIKVGNVLNETTLINLPLLSDFNFSDVLKPLEVYLDLIDWLSKKEDVQANITNEQKIISHGFDLKSSFRKG